MLYEGMEMAHEAELALQRPWSASSTQHFPDLMPIAYLLLGWLGFSLILHIIAWFINGKGSLMDSMRMTGRMIGIIALLEAARLGATLNGLHEWAGFAGFMLGFLSVLGWTGRTWGKVHLLSRKETWVATLTCFYAPVLAAAAVTAFPLINLLR